MGIIQVFTLMCALWPAGQLAHAQAREQIYHAGIITLAGEISYVDVFKDNGAYSLEINGGIERLARWVDALNTIPDNTDFSVVLSSPGGLVDEAIRIAQNIKNKCHSPFTPDRKSRCTITTVVKNKTSCVSTCTLIYATGDVRAAEAGAVFGFHAAAAFRDFGGYDMAPPEVTMAPYLLYSDVDHSWWKMLFEQGVFSTVEITYLTREDMNGGNFVTLWL